MKLSRIIQTLALTVTWSCCLPARGQTPFNSGSDGSYGPLVADGTVGSKVVQIPPNGILNCTTVTIGYPANVTFTKNATNTPVYILATGDVNIGGFIFVSGGNNVGARGGNGGPGAFDGGQGGANPSNGFGPGGGKGGWGGTTATPANKLVRGAAGNAIQGGPTGTGGNAYGNALLIPLVGGSGGGGAAETDVANQFGGGGGGGALLIASNTKVTFTHESSGYIQATGGNTNNGTGGGSGGAIRIVAPTVTGVANFYMAGFAQGGTGRIRIDTLSNSMSFNSTDTSANYATFGANMVVFPTNLPELRVTKAAGTDIALTQTDPVFVLLPSGAPATQTITVQAKNFNSAVPLVAVVTPEAGDRTTYNFDIDNTAGGATTGSVQVQIPAGVSTRIDVWTR